MKLSQYMDAKKLDDAAFAAMVGGLRSAKGVAKWRRGERVPRADQMRRIVEVTQGAVTPNDFYEIDPARALESGSPHREAAE